MKSQWHEAYQTAFHLLTYCTNSIITISQQHCDIHIINKEHNIGNYKTNAQFFLNTRQINQFLLLFVVKTKAGIFFAEL